MGTPTLSDRLELHRRFWRGELGRPLLGFFFTEPTHGDAPGCPNVDIDTPPNLVIEKHRAGARRQNGLPGERVAEVSLNYGTSFLPALAGADYRHDGDTSWCIPTGLTAEELVVPPLDRDLPLWRSYEEKLRALMGAHIEDAVLSTGAMTGPMEMLLGLLGPEQLSLDMVDRPDAVSARGLDCLRLWRECFDAQWDILGRPGGNAGFGVYMPGKSGLFTEDGLALTGPWHFRRFFHDVIADLTAFLDVPFIHTHSVALGCLDELARIEGLTGIEISNDPGGPALARILEAGRRCQEAGKSVMFSNWMKPLSDTEVDALLDGADPCRTLITLTVASPAEAESCLRKADRRFGPA